MKDCNKKIYEKIREYLDTCLTPFVEIVIEYIDEPGRNLHQVVQYNITGSGTWLGVIGNMFDFDFFDIKEVVSFVPLCNLTAAENSVVTIDDDDENYSRMAEIEKLPDENSYLPIDIGDYLAKHLFEIMGE